MHGTRSAEGPRLSLRSGPAEIARTILRRADASITQEHYILLKSQKEGRIAMKRLRKIVRQKFDSQACREP
jgi:hypothetical protein